MVSETEVTAGDGAIGIHLRLLFSHHNPGGSVREVFQQRNQRCKCRLKPRGDCGNPVGNFYAGVAPSQTKDHASIKLAGK